jgi:hypothetical protein
MLHSRCGLPNRCKLAIALFLLTAGSTMAQTVSTSAAIRGVITDPSGAAVPSAAITVTNEATGARRVSASDVEGRYEVLVLPVGTYSVTVEAQGFRTVTNTGIKLETGRVAVLNIQVEVGAIAEQVTVEAAPPLMETSHAAIGEVVQNKAVLELPLDGRSFASLALITPQVSPGRSQAQWYPVMPGASLDVTISGSRAENNQVTLDSTTVTNDYTGGTMVYPSVDALQEFKIVQGSYSADLGARLGQILLVTKSGTNEFHGSAFEFLRNDALDARNFFDARKFSLRQNQFGAALGGPVMLPTIYDGKNKTHFFLSYEGTRIHRGATGLYSVPTAVMRRGDLRESGRIVRDPVTKEPFPDNTIPASRLDPIAVGLFDKLSYPLPNYPGVSQNYRISPVNTRTLNQGSARLDHSFSDSDKISGTFQISRYEINDARTTLVPPYERRIPSFVISTNYTHVFSPRMLNIMKVGYSDFRPLDPNLNPPNLTIRELGFPNDPYQALAHGRSAGPPRFGFTGFSAMGGGSGPFGLYTTHKDFSETFNYVKGAHSLKFGYNFIRTWLDTETAWNFRGSYSFSGIYSGYGLGDLLLGLPSSTTREIPFGADPFATPPKLGVDQFESSHYENHHYAFAQDDWRVSQKLSITLGLRWEFNQPVVEAEDRLANFIPGVLNGEPRIVKIFPPSYQGADRQVPTPPELGRSLLRSYKKNFAPRLGIAWSPTPKWVVRMGGGFFYADPPYNVKQILPDNSPWFWRQIFTNDIDNPTITLAQGFKELGTLSSGGFGINPDYRDSATYQWSFNIQRQLTRHTVMDAFYIGSRAIHLDGQENLNVAKPGPGPLGPRRPYPKDPSYYYYSSWGFSRYNGFTFRVKQELSRGLNFLAHFTASRSLDTGHTQLFGPQNNYNLFAEYAPSSTNIPRRFVASFVYELPVGPGKPALSHGLLSKILGGWTVTGILIMQDGYPFHATPSINTLNSEWSSLRPDRIRDGNLPKDQRTRLRWFDTDAFAQPALYTFGNSGRNFLEGPGLRSIDAGLLKNIAFTESKSLQFRAEFFNLPNFVNWGFPGSSIGTPTYGQIWSAGTSRDIQFGLKLLF